MERKAKFLTTRYGAYWHRQIPQEDTELTHVGPGTPGGEYLRRFWQPVAIAAWKAKPCWFIVTTEDRVVSAELQTAEAKRMEAKITLIKSSHMSLLSHPGEVAAVIEDAAATVAA